MEQATVAAKWWGIFVLTAIGIAIAGILLVL